MHARPFSLSDNKPLRWWHVARAARLCKHIALLVDERYVFVERNGLDQRFCLPDANWSTSAENDFYDAYRHLVQGGRKALERLRFLCQPFTGFQLQTMRMAQGLPSVRQVQDDFDATFRAQAADAWVECWENHTRDLPNDVLFRPPPRLGEIGWIKRGIIVNHDTYTYQERVNLLLDNGIIAALRRKWRPRILEIGGGYGALALALRQITNARYVICDLPEALMFSGLYLGIAGKQRVGIWPRQSTVTLVPNYRFDELRGPFDLIINTLSMAEMSEYQVRYYASRIRGLLAPGGAFFEQNQDNSSVGMLNAKPIIAEYLDGAEIQSKHSARVNGAAHLWR